MANRDFNSPPQAPLSDLDGRHFHERAPLWHEHNPSNSGGGSSVNMPSYSRLPPPRPSSGVSLPPLRLGLTGPATESYGSFLGQRNDFEAKSWPGEDLYRQQLTNSHEPPTLDHPLTDRQTSQWPHHSFPPISDIPKPPPLQPGGNIPPVMRPYPKPRPAYAGFDPSDLHEENDLPEPNLAAIEHSRLRAPAGKGTMAPRQDATARGRGRGGAARGGRRGRGAKGGAKRKHCEVDLSGESDSEAEVRGKKGRQVGAVKWSEADFTALLDLVEELLPAGKKEWLRLYARFEAWARENGRSIRSAETVEKRYKTLVRVAMPTGDAECPPEVERAHQLEHEINNRVASGVVRDDDLDDEVIEISSDDSPARQKPKETKGQPTYVARHVKLEPGTERPRTSAAQLRGTLQNVAKAFDPVAQAARDETRQAHRMEALHMQTLMSQLRDSEAEVRSLRKEAQLLQRDLDRETRRADNAERDLRIFEMVHMGPRRSAHPKFSPGPTPRIATKFRPMTRSSESSPPAVSRLIMDSSPLPTSSAPQTSDSHMPTVPQPVEALPTSGLSTLADTALMFQTTHHTAFEHGGISSPGEHIHWPATPGRS